MKSVFLFIGLVAAQVINAQSQKINIGESPKQSAEPAVDYLYEVGNIGRTTDSAPTINLREVDIVSFKTAEEWMMYYKYKSRIQTILPYVKIAKQLYAELLNEKENTKRKDFRSYRKSLESEMRNRFEKELKNLNTGQGEMLFKLLNRETGNNAYFIIKELKGGVTAWFYQQVGKRFGYDLKETYDPDKEKMIELIIREMGPAYNVNS